MNSIVLIIVAIITLIWLFKLLVPSSHLRKYGNKIPGPKPLPIIGNALDFLTRNTFLEAFLQVLKDHEPITRIWLGKQLFIVLTDYKDIEMFLSRPIHLNKSKSYRLFDSWLGNTGMLTGDADVWRTHRKLLTPSFHFKILENAVGMIEKHAKILCQQLESNIAQREFDITEYIEKCSLDIICETAMGIDLQCQTARYSQYLENLKKISKIIIQRSFSPWLQSNIIFRFSIPGRTYFRSLEKVKKFIRKVITSRKEMLMNQRNTNNTDEDDADTKTPKPFLDFILTESNFTQQEIEDEVQTFMFAGHDTTKAAISFTLYALSQNPQIQDELIKEIDETLAKKGDNLSLHDYSSMKYLDKVIKESLRMYSPVPIIGREVEADVKLPSGFTLPAGSQASFCLLYLHNSEKYYKHPEKFMPDRFENQEQNKPYSYIPFSAGSRNCVGQKFANLELKIVLFTFFQKYRLLPATEQTSIELELYLVLRSLNGLPIRIINRETPAKSRENS